MRDADARPVARAWRDAVLLVAVTVVIIAGLVHYGSRLGNDDHHVATPAATLGSTSGSTPGSTLGPSLGTTSAPTPTAAMSSDAAQLDSGPSGGPAAQKPAATCWDGRKARRLSLCGLPQGVAGLRYVFPSLAVEGDGRCHRSAQPSIGYDTVLSWTCFDHADGQPVTITYDQVSNLRQAKHWFETAYVNGSRHNLPGPHGGRVVWFDGDSQPAKATGMYNQFPYAVSVWAPTRQAAKAAWAHIVQLRPSRTIKGSPAKG
jgi:hypothetical protein